MIYRVDNFSECSINPITNNEYDSSWIVLILNDSNEYHQYVGSKNGCAYTVKISRLKCENWAMNIGDFISFHEENNKNIILVMTESDYQIIKNQYTNYKHKDSFLRDKEPSVLVHSTSMKSWEQIKQDGMLKCWNRLKYENSISEKSPIGIKLGDPYDFSDYIMLGSGITGEIVVNSRQKENIIMDIDSEYITGVRLYFDVEKIAQDGLLVRDGTHYKVKDHLPLYPYLLWVASWNNIGLKNQISTPKIFAELSDRTFQNYFRKQR